MFNKENKKKVYIILTIILIIFIIVNLILYRNKTKEPTYTLPQTNQQKDEKAEQVEVPKTEEEIVKKLSVLGERDRMEYYCGVYFKHLEKKEYEEAYNLLYPEFKNNYFPTLEQYQEYIEKTYPKVWALEYDDITRQGYIYVLKLKIDDVLGSKENQKSQRIVVKENNYNDFVISFQVIGNNTETSNEDSNQDDVNNENTLQNTIENDDGTQENE